MIIDIVVGAVLLISALISFFRGFIREVLTIAGVAGGGLAALTFGSSLSPVFRKWLGVVDGQPVTKLFDLIPMTIIADVCAYAAIFIAVVITISVISHFISSGVKAMGLGPIDRTFGVIFGIVRAVLLLGLLYLPFHLLMDDAAKEKYFGTSKTHIYVEKTSNFIAGFLPSSKEVKDKVEDVTDGQIKQKLLDHDILNNGNSDPIILEQLDQEPADENKTENEETGTGYKTKQRRELEDLLSEPSFNE